MKKIVLILVIVLAAALVFWKTREGAPEEVSFYAKVKTLSTSGSTAFYYYDLENGKTDCERKDCWFWGMLRHSEDEEKAMAYFQFLSDREGAVFKVTGVKEADDCEYLEGQCLTSLILDKVETVRLIN
jgi:hypothetical protein